MVYLMRYACHLRTEASEGVYLLDHEAVIIRQIKPRSSAACVGVVHHALYIRAAVLGIARLASLGATWGVACIGISTTVYARHHRITASDSTARLAVRAIGGRTLTALTVGAVVGERLVDTARLAYLGGHMITLETYVMFNLC